MVYLINWWGRFKDILVLNW